MHDAPADTAAVPPFTTPFTTPCDPDTLKTRLAAMYRDVFADPDALAAYFRDDYTQTTDGVTSDRAAFAAHIRHVAEAVHALRFSVLDACWQEDTVADRHHVHVTYRDGRTAVIEVYLFGRLRDGRFARVHEATRVLSGDHAARDLASATG